MLAYRHMSSLLLRAWQYKIVGIDVRRCFTAHQASVALRPFYKMVHPDCFGLEPEARANNERALQIFNGYLDECLNKSKRSFSLKPISITFTIRRRDALENVHIQLSGADPAHIVRTALERCQLSTGNIPKSAIGSPLGTTTNNVNSMRRTWSDDDDLWRKLHEDDLRRQKCSASHRPSPNDLSAWASEYRKNALKRLQNFDRVREQLDDQIYEIVRKTGLKDINWTINWDQSYMRRCLTSIDDMISQAETSLRNTIASALMGRTLILGRGSHVCCDGSLQFGADDATGAWQKVCLEADVRCFELHNLRLITERVRELFGGAELVVRPHSSLLATTEYMKTIIVRISLRPRGVRQQIADLSVGTVVEIMNAYCELTILSDGRLHIPCNVDPDSLVTFLAAHTQESIDLRRIYTRQQTIIADMCRQCCYKLNLRSVTWDPGVVNEDLIDALQRLESAGSKPIAKSLSNMALHFSHSPNVYLLSTGKLAIPIDWV